MCERKTARDVATNRSCHTRFLQTNPQKDLCPGGGMLMFYFKKTVGSLRLLQVHTVGLGV